MVNSFSRVNNVFFRVTISDLFTGNIQNKNNEEYGVINLGDKNDVYNVGDIN
jgi:hypothetical protein